MNQSTDFALRRRRHALREVISRVEREIDCLDLSDNCDTNARTRIDFLREVEAEAYVQIDEINKKLNASDKAKQYVDDLVNKFLS